METLVIVYDVTATTKHLDNKRQKYFLELGDSRDDMIKNINQSIEYWRSPIDSVEKNEVTDKDIIRKVIQEDIDHYEGVVKHINNRRDILKKHL